MIRMLRFRGKRSWFLILGAIATFLIFRWSHQPDPHVQDFDWNPSGQNAHLEPPPAKPPTKPETPAVIEELKETSKSPVADVETPAPSPKQDPQTEVVVAEKTIAPKSTPAPAAVQTVPPVVLPDRQRPAPGGDVYNNEVDNGDDIQSESSPTGQETPIVPTPTKIHWVKQTEHFPVPTESIIHLPTGDPVKIPKIQHNFDDETTDAKITREKRQTRVKLEFQRAWKGYKDHAWLHDELSPVSGKYRDPFCGWAATLVDALDTLWIMGLEEEFEEAAGAVDLIDFTTSPRPDIPMFETTIRYLGGLLAAYDVSGGKYKNLLAKAVELADVMMGAFDTPNRMPVLYYRWSPAFASQPHRAGTSANTAELGSLSLEFTRLAQLTHEPRYYDAVARITDALSEWQDRGTPLDGVFPENIDASGCNRTVVAAPQGVSGDQVPPQTPSEEPVGYRPQGLDKKVGEPKSNSTLEAESSDAVETKSIPVQPEKAKADGEETMSKDQEHIQMKIKRDLSEKPVDGNKTTTREIPNDPTTGLPVDIPAAKANVGTRVGEWDCVPQGLEPSNPSGINRFSMGGGQDSTYEYFSKQYLLLGGLEPKYSKMYKKTIEAVRKHMVFRPMVPGDRSILFSGAVSVSKYSSDITLSPEVEHLTCFIGGMVGMGAKIFELEGDLEIAKKLTDGCVWAYESFPSGIMPEGSLVVPCNSTEQCPWNEAEYWMKVDPMGDSRDQMVKDYITNKAARQAELKAAKEAELKAAKEAELQAAKEAAAPPPTPVSGDGDTEEPKAIPDSNPSTLAGTAKPTDAPVDSGSSTTRVPTSSSGETAQQLQGPKSKPQPEDLPASNDNAKREVSAPLRKRDSEESLESRQNDTLISNTRSEHSEPKPAGKKLAKDEDTPATTTSDPASGKSKVSPGDSTDSMHNISPGEQEYDDFVRVSEGASGQEAEVPLADGSSKSTESSETPEDDPMMPMNHKQWVASRIEQEKLPPGFTSIRSRTYILRPEAIESVWYMYRLTGDTSWQEKGWKMFESILKATSSEYGHSAIFDVTIKQPYQVDEMESFWLAETLKYFYLLFASPDVISLDEWVLNTEAHPFKRPV